MLRSFALAALLTGAAFNPPEDSAIPPGPMGDAIRLGQNILRDTPRYAKENIGKDLNLNCTSCHLNQGRTQFAAPWVGIWGAFPEFRPRNAKVNVLQDRVNDCFERSMNGKALDPAGDKMTAIMAYMGWLSKGVPTGSDVAGRGFKKIKPDHAPDVARGKLLYEQKCMVCHLADGGGQSGPKGEYMFPAIWGPKSFNIGAGMARLNTAAAFIQANMPLGQGGTLTNQEAFDIAAYFTRQPRPDFAKKARDWPKGNKPSDARY